MLPQRFEVVRKMPFIKKIFIQFVYKEGDKEKSGTVTKLELVKKKHNQKFKIISFIL